MCKKNGRKISSLFENSYQQMVGQRLSLKWAGKKREFVIFIKALTQNNLV